MVALLERALGFIQGKRPEYSFEEQVRHLRENEIGMIMTNPGGAILPPPTYDFLSVCAHPHQITVAKHLLREAGDRREPVKLIDTLDERFYDELVPDANYCMAKGSDIEIISLCLDENPSESRFEKTVRSHGFKIIKTHYSHGAPRFIVVGDKRWLNFNAGNASFNNSSIANTMLGCYQWIKDTHLNSDSRTSSS